MGTFPIYCDLFYTNNTHSLKYFKTQKITGLKHGLKGIYKKVFKLFNFNQKHIYSIKSLKYIILFLKFKAC